MPRAPLPPPRTAILFAYRGSIARGTYAGLIDDKDAIEVAVPGLDHCIGRRQSGMPTALLAGTAGPGGPEDLVDRLSRTPLERLPWRELSVRTLKRRADRLLSRVGGQARPEQN